MWPSLVEVANLSPELQLLPKALHSGQYVEPIHVLSEEPGVFHQQSFEVQCDDGLGKINLLLFTLSLATMENRSIHIFLAGC